MTATYAFDPLSRRKTKTVNSVTTDYLSEGDREIAEYNGSGTFQRRMVYGPGLDEPVVIIDASSVKNYVHTDGLGSIVALTNASGTVIDKYTYSPFGESASLAGAASRFTGRRIDPETGLYHYRARAYSPTIGRFLQPDPIGHRGGINLYVYALNDPLNLTDPFGLFGELSGSELAGVYSGYTPDFTHLASIASSGLQGRSSNLLTGSKSGGALSFPGVSTIQNWSLDNSPQAGPKEAFHYTYSENVPSIEEKGLFEGSWATPNELSPLQAQVELALKPNQGLPDAVFRIDLQAYQQGGYEIPSVTRVQGWYNMPGGGYEMKFPEAIPPEFIEFMPIIEP